MTNKFDATKFTPTEFSTVKDKLKFANQFKKFVLGGFQAKDFPKWFYVQLSMCFNMIAHYSQGDFYNYYFTNLADKAYFINQVMEYGCWGSPAFTYCDVEKQIQEWLKSEELA